MNVLSSGIYLTPEHWAQMAADVAARIPEEACGIVAGIANHSRLVIPVTNILHDPFRFRMDPEEELKAFLQIEEQGWEALAIYHSHPQGINTPSVTDLNELTFPGIVYLIWYQDANEWQCRGFLMSNDASFREIPLILSTNM